MSNLVVKSNELNSIALFKNTLALKIFAKLITVIREEPDEEFFKLSIKELFEDFKGSKENYSYIKQTIRKMGMIEIGKRDDGFFLISTFSKVKAENGKIDFKINEDLKPHIVGLLKNFTSYYFENIATLKSGFSIRLYEIMKQWEKAGHKKFSIPAIRELLGIEEGKYKTYNNFKRRVLLVAQRELEEKTDIKFDFEEIKTGRRITHIHFFIKPNPKKAIQGEEVGNISTTIKELFEALKIPLVTQKKIVEQYQEERLVSNLKYTLGELKRGKIKTTTTAFLIASLQNDFANQTTLFNSQEMRKEQEEAEKRAKKEQEEAKKKFYDNRNKKIFDYIEKNRENLGELFPEFLENNRYLLENVLKIQIDELGEQETRQLINENETIKGLFKEFIAKKILPENERVFKN